MERVLLNASSSYAVAPIPLGACGDYSVIAVGGGGSGKFLWRFRPVRMDPLVQEVPATVEGVDIVMIV